MRFSGSFSNLDFDRRKVTVQLDSQKCRKMVNSDWPIVDDPFPIGWNAWHFLNLTSFPPPKLRQLVPP